MANAQSTAFVALLPTIFAPPRSPTIKGTPAKSSNALCRSMRELLSPARMNVSTWLFDTTDKILMPKRSAGLFSRLAAASFANSLDTAYALLLGTSAVTSLGRYLFDEEEIQGG